VIPLVAVVTLTEDGSLSVLLGELAEAMEGFILGALVGVVRGTAGTVGVFVFTPFVTAIVVVVVVVIFVAVVDTVFVTVFVPIRVVLLVMLVILLDLQRLPLHEQTQPILEHIFCGEDVWSEEGEGGVSGAPVQASQSVDQCPPGDRRGPALAGVG
jgi:hypothetical protein